MKRLLRLAVVVTTLTLPAVCQAFSVSGSYDSTEGVVTLNQSGDRVTGRYTNDNGELTGQMFDNVFEGFWIEDGSDRRCASPKNGRYYWGRVTLEFSGNGFAGKWSHCNDAPSHPWTGTRRGGRPAPPPQTGNTADPFAVIDGINIEGTWSSSEGDIRFRQQGNRIAGRYTNDNGEIVGSLDNDRLRGYWIEDHSSKRCSSPKNGRYFWGRLEFHFSDNRFSGKWGYCDDPATSNWSGQRK